MNQLDRATVVLPRLQRARRFHLQQVIENQLDVGRRKMHHSMSTTQHGHVCVPLQQPAEMLAWPRLDQKDTLPYTARQRIQ